LIVVPIACVVMFGKMLSNFRHAAVVFGVMTVQVIVFLIVTIAADALHPNPAVVGHPEQSFNLTVVSENGTPGVRTVVSPARPKLPVDSALGNLEGKELRFGTSAGATHAVLTTCTSNGSVNAMHDSLNPLAGLVPMIDMWINCNYGGIGVGLINLMLYLIVAVFFAGLMVGRTPEYLGKKVEAREMKLALLGLLAHPILILAPTGLFAALDWGKKATNNPGPHGFTEILYEFTSSSANNGSGFEGLGDTFGFNDPKENPTPAPYSVHWDIATGLVMLFARFIPIVAPLALAASLSAKKPTPFTAGTLRTDNATFGIFLLGVILLVGALLFLPAALLGPVAETLGPTPFGN
jgi:K+-transporting ATPase ATPase A chain